METTKCAPVICDASTYLKVIEDFEKKHKVIRRIESCSMMMMQNPAAGIGTVKMPGIQQQIPAVVICIVFIYEEKESVLKITPEPKAIFQP